MPKRPISQRQFGIATEAKGRRLAISDFWDVAKLGGSERLYRAKIGQ
jgi:hypothetical protein